MSAAGVASPAIASFLRLLGLVRAGDTGMIPEADITPVAGLPDADELDADPPPRDVLDATVIIKLNGGLGTSMGMDRAKSLLVVKDGLSFLDIIVRQCLAMRARHGVRLPLVLMNSFRTRDDSLAVLSGYPELASDVDADFLQHKVPKVRADDLMPVQWDRDRSMEWCPPGHGDLYAAVVTSGMLETLRDRGYRYAFVSNADNLGATLDERILAWFAREGMPFLMEAADRTEADRKGGHLAHTADGRLVLRESAQCPGGDVEAFSDVKRHRYFNTNTLWLDLDALAGVLEANDGIVPLPLIRNEKTVDPTDAESPAVYQLETAMGAAISTFDGAGAIRVPRTRFAPVKTTNDLLGLWSDGYVLSEGYRVVVNPERPAESGTLFVDLDPASYRYVSSLEERFPAGAPSLVACRRFVVRGDVRFGGGVVVRGDVEVDADSCGGMVPDGTVLDGA
ncbi:MAG: UTP--glucose-1-phosphate uridylyltransferase [Acidimicrobiia bacterium]|nr:UTP--glucose-1-phosphate uridylyltransferase [Acidimicrobiia bacterium]